MVHDVWVVEHSIGERQDYGTLHTATRTITVRNTVSGIVEGAWNYCHLDNHQ